MAVAGVLIGIGAMSSVIFPYSIPQDSGFRNVAAGQGALAYVSFFAGMVVGSIICAPLIALMVVLHSNNSGLLWVLLPLGILYGTAVAYGGLRWSARLTADRLPEILAAVSKG